MRGKSTMFGTLARAIAVALLLAGTPALAQEEGGHSSPEIGKFPWSFSGPFGSYDQHQLQRGFQIYREVCAQCHSLRLIAFRNLSEFGGPSFSEGQVKALAAEYTIPDPSSDTGTRPAVPADRIPSPYASDEDARVANGGILPPDLSVMAKARGTTQPFPWWILNYFTAYQEGGPDYIHALMTGYQDPPPAGANVAPGMYYNEYFPGHAIGMPPPLKPDLVTYDAPPEGARAVPQTVEQYSQDVSAFLMWAADPHMVSRKEAGLRVITFLILFAGLMWAVKQKLWSRVEH